MARSIPQILAATLESQVSGYPVYDRELLDRIVGKERTNNANW
jgi:hypothetical protein